MYAKAINLSSIYMAPGLNSLSASTVSSKPLVDK